MKIVLRILAVLLVGIAVLLIWAVIAAANSAGGARTGVAIGYVAGAIVCLVLAVKAWRGRRTPAVESGA
jgi:multisubunit Na+/H+ antiporter MnhB subunit